MPLTDSYGQNIPYPTLTDKPNAQTLGQGIVEGLTPKSVMSFPSASVRGATISNPVSGMVTWLDDEERMELFDGASWVSFAYGTNQWTNVTLATPWVNGPDGNGANSNGPFQYRKVNLFGEPTLFFRGAIQRGNPVTYPSDPPNPLTITGTPLPAAVRPVFKRTVSIPVSDAGSTRITLKMDIETSGNLSIWGFGPNDKPQWIGFNGVFCSL